MKINIRKSTKKRTKMVGFRVRMKTKGGRKMLSRRRRIGREFNTKTYKAK